MWGCWMGKLQETWVPNPVATCDPFPHIGWGNRVFGLVPLPPPPPILGLVGGFRIFGIKEPHQWLLAAGPKDVPLGHIHTLVMGRLKMCWGWGAVQSVCKGAIVLNRDPIIAGMCPGSSGTTEIQEKDNRSTNCHQFVVSVTFQMNEWNETMFESILGSLCQPQSVQCPELWARRLLKTPLGCLPGLLWEASPHSCSAGF